MPRHESPVWPGATPALKQLVDAMREEKARSGLAYAELAERTHFSPATLSIAASGKRMPTWDVTWAYVCGCDPEAMEDTWTTKWEAAKEAETNRRAASGNPEADRPPEPGSSSRRPDGRRRASVAELVRDEVARQQQFLPYRPSDIDAVRTALALCTTEEDFRALLNELKGPFTPDELKERARRKGRVLRKSDIHAMLDGEGVPETEPLHAFLLACDVAQGQIHEWHHTATRLKISQARVDEPLTGESALWQIRLGVRRLRGVLDLNTLIGLLCTVVVTAIQIMAVIKYGI